MNGREKRAVGEKRQGPPLAALPLDNCGVEQHFQMFTEKHICIWASILKIMLVPASLLLCYLILSELSSKHMSEASTD